MLHDNAYQPVIAYGETRNDARNAAATQVYGMLLPCGTKPDIQALVVLGPAIAQLDAEQKRAKDEEKRRRLEEKLKVEITSLTQ